MIQLTNDAGYQSFYLKLDGYDTTALTNVRVTIVNQLTGKLTAFGLVTPTAANGRYTTIQIEIAASPKLVEGLYLLTVKNDANNVTYAKRLAFVSSTPAFEESTYTPYEENDTDAYERIRTMNKQNFSILQYQATNVPLFRESQNKLWIDMGVDNLYPHYLEELFASSSMHGAIIKGASEMIYGEGLNAIGKDKHVDQWLKVNSIFGDGSCLKKAAFDLKLYGQCYLNIIWSQDRTTVSRVHHLPAATIRCGIADDEDNIPLFYHKKDWDKQQEEPLVIPAFNTNDRTAPSQCLHIKMYTPLSFYYGAPDYQAGTNWAQIASDLSDYHLSTISQGFFPSTIMSFFGGVPTEEERAELERLVYNKFGGANNAGKILMTFNDSQDTAPTVESFNISDAHQIFDYLSEQCDKKVLSAHRVTSPLLFGLRDTGGGFGNNADEMKESYDLFYNTVILPFQRLLLDGLRPVFAASNVTLELYFTPMKPASFVDVDNLFNPVAAGDSSDKDASYDGGQIGSAVDVLVKVQEGLITVDQAKVFLVQMLQFTPEVADALFREGVDAIEEVQKEEVQEEAIAETQLKKKTLS